MQPALLGRDSVRSWVAVLEREGLVTEPRPTTAVAVLLDTTDDTLS